MKLYKILLIAAGVFASCAAYGQSELSAADSAYNAKDYTKAIEIYNDVAENSGVSAALLFNLGNAYVQNGDYGNAMLSYQRAKKLDPSNERINSNLKYLAGKVEDANKSEQKTGKKKVTEDTPNFFQNVNATITQETSSDLWAGFAAAMFILFSGCVALYLFTSNVLLRKTGFFGGILLLGVSIVCLVCGYMGAAEMENREYGVIISYKATLMTEPNVTENNNKNEGVLTRGTKVRIISEEVDAEGNITWYKVRLNSDYIGWLESKELAII